MRATKTDVTPAKIDEYLTRCKQNCMNGPVEITDEPEGVVDARQIGHEFKRISVGTWRKQGLEVAGRKLIASEFMPGPKSGTIPYRPA